jgi:hypothetical protein
MNTRLGWGVTVILAAVIGAGEASAVDIDGKWGIGAVRWAQRPGPAQLPPPPSVVFMPSSGLGPKLSVAPAG